MAEDDVQRTRKLTDQALPRAHARDDPTTCHALEDVFAVPSHEMAVVDDVFLAFLQLQTDKSSAMPPVPYLLT